MVYVCASQSTATDKTSSLLPKFSQENQRRARHVSRKGGDRQWNGVRSGILWLYFKCHQNSQEGAEARTLDYGSATVCARSHPRFSISKLYFEKVKETCILPEHKRRRKREKIAMTRRHLALNFNQLLPNPSSYLFLEYPVAATVLSGTVYFRHLCFYS